MTSPKEPHDFTPSSSTNASFTAPTEASQLAKGDYILIKTHPCRIISKSTSKPGKHGHAKISFEAIDTLTGKRHTHLSPAHGTVSVPVVVRKEYLLLDITSDGYLNLFDQHTGQSKDDVRAPTEGEVAERLGKLWAKEGEKGIWVSVLGTMGREIVDGVKDVEGGL
ncbi:MAG: hypothetical protein Q9166_007114 [cf. Caloplaca sp. 2 TL-2023]